MYNNFKISVSLDQVLIDFNQTIVDKINQAGGYDYLSAESLDETSTLDLRSRFRHFGIDDIDPFFESVNPKYDLIWQPWAEEFSQEIKLLGEVRFIIPVPIKSYNYFAEAVAQKLHTKKENIFVYIRPSLDYDSGKNQTNAILSANYESIKSASYSGIGSITFLQNSNSHRFYHENQNQELLNVSVVDHPLDFFEVISNLRS